MRAGPPHHRAVSRSTPRRLALPAGKRAAREISRAEACSKREGSPPVQRYASRAAHVGAGQRRRVDDPRERIPRLCSRGIPDDPTASEERGRRPARQPAARRANAGSPVELLEVRAEPARELRDWASMPPRRARCRRGSSTSLALPAGGGGPANRQPNTGSSGLVAVQGSPRAALNHRRVKRASSAANAEVPALSGVHRQTREAAPRPAAEISAYWWGAHEEHRPEARREVPAARSRARAGDLACSPRGRVHGRFARTRERCSTPKGIGREEDAVRGVPAAAGRDVLRV